MKNVSTTNTATKYFGQQVASPVMIAATGLMKLLHEEGELAVARAAEKRNMVYVYNYVFSTTAIEEVAAVRKNGVQWASLYILKQRDYVVAAIRKIQDLGFSAIVLTCDHPHDRVKNTNMMRFEASGDVDNLQKIMVSPNYNNFLISQGRPPEDTFGANDDTLTW